MSESQSIFENPVPTHLAKLNPHERDKDISFEEGPHIYTVLGDRGGYTSVTTWNHRHFSEFNSDKIITNILNGKKWNTDPTYKYYKMSRESINQMWDDNRDQAARAGTKMHYDIECYYNDMDIEVQEECIEWKYFEEFE